MRIWLLISLAAVFIVTGCHSDDDDVSSDDDLSGDDDSTADDDTTSDDDSSGDDDSTGDDDSAGDDDSTPDPDDLDGDGWTVDEGDCNDNDPAINPGIIDDLCDGINAACGSGQEILVPSDYPSVQGAIDATSDGDRVCVAQGVYHEGIYFMGKLVHVWGAEAVPSPWRLTPTLTDLIVTGNVAENNGGGIYISDTCAPSLTNVTISDNTAGYEGGGLYVASGPLPVLEDLVVTGNYADSSGGGALFVGSGVTLTRSTFRDNEAGYSGGGIALSLLQSGSSVLTDIVVEGNRAAAYGGGISATGGVVQLVRARLVGNEALITAGGIYGAGVHLNMEQVVFAGNESQWGGGMTMEGASASLSNVSVVGNSASESGGGISSYGPEVVSLQNTIVTHNTSGVSGGGIACGGCVAPLTYSDVWGNIPDDFDGMPDPVGQYGNISVDPEFLDLSDPNPLNWDLHLALSSPLIDAGGLGPLDPDGSPSDMGAYGGTGAGGWDLDLDGYPEWWQPGGYDVISYPGLGWDCDDLDPSIYPGATDLGGNGVDEDCDGVDGP